MSSSTEPRAYGAGVAGSPFDLIAFLKKPKVILETLAWIFAIIVFACIAQGGYWNDTCRYNGSTACNYGIAIGVIAFIIALVFTVIDIFLKNVSSASIRKIIVLGELIAAGIWTFLWFVGFCFMADQWRVQEPKDLPGWNGRDNVQAAIAFSFFSVLVWGVLTFFIFRDFREGVSTAFSGESGFPQTYANYPPPSSNIDGYSPSQPPFTATQPPLPNYDQRIN